MGMIVSGLRDECRPAADGHPPHPHRPVMLSNMDSSRPVVPRDETGRVFQIEQVLAQMDEVPAVF